MLAKKLKIKDSINMNKLEIERLKNIINEIEEKNNQNLTENEKLNNIEESNKIMAKFKGDFSKECSNEVLRKYVKILSKVE